MINFIEKFKISKGTLFLIISAISSVISYCFVKTFTAGNSIFPFLNQYTLPIRADQMFWHTNFSALLFFVIFKKTIHKKMNIDIFDISIYKMNKFCIIALIPMIGAAFFKSYLISEYSLNLITTNDLLTPVITTLICAILFKEKLTVKYFIALSICIFGLWITKINESVGLNYFILLYVLINAIGNSSVRYIAKNRQNMEGFIVECLLYSIGAVLSFYFVGGFNVKYIFCPQVIIVMLFTISHHYFIIKAHQYIQETKNAIILDYAKTSIKYAGNFIFFADFLNFYQFLGIIIMNIGIGLYSYKRK